MLKMPDGITTCLFDLDGVLTQTAKIHAQAWKEMFDGFLRDWGERNGEPFEEFDRPTDYDEYVDGKPRLDGVRSFLESRGIDVPMGSPTDPPDAETVHALGTRKNELVLELIRRQGVEPYEGSVRFSEAARDAGLRRAVVSSSTNCKDVLVAAGIDHLYEARIDGVVAEREQLAGKPAPDTFLAGARVLGAEPPRGRHRRAGPRRAAGAHMIGQDVFAVEPWAVPERELHLELLPQTESIFALSNGHIGLRGNLDEGEPSGAPGTFLNGFYEVRPLPYAEAAYGNPEAGQTIINVTNGKVVRLLVDDEPFDVRYGHLGSHERCLDLRDGVLRREVEWTSPAGQAV